MFEKIKETLLAFRKPVGIINENKLYYYKGLVLNVVDGDTFDILIDQGFSVYQNIRFRLAKYNTPEVRGEEREEGLRVKEVVKELIEGQTVILKSVRKGSFQRYLAEIWVDNKHLGDFLYENGDANIWSK